MSAPLIGCVGKGDLPDHLEGMGAMRGDAFSLICSSSLLDSFYALNNTIYIIIYTTNYHKNVCYLLIEALLRIDI